MLDLSHLDWPFFEAPHRRVAADFANWAKREVAPQVNHADVDGSCRTLVRALGEAGWLRAGVPAAQGGLSEKLDVRTLCFAREILAWNDSLADIACCCPP